MTQPPRLGLIEQALGALFPADVAVAVCDLASADTGLLWPEEHAAIVRAVPKRLAEFAAGRQAARQALARLGHQPLALPMGPDRAPLWPEGISGSIAHAAGLAVAAVRRGRPLGVDVEEDAPISTDLWPILTLPMERDALPSGERGQLIRRVFAAKEALFKAQAQGARVMFGFDAVSVTLVDGGFNAQFLATVGTFRAGDILHGRLALVEGLVLAGVAR